MTAQVRWILENDVLGRAKAIEAIGFVRIRFRPQPRIRLQPLIQRLQQRLRDLSQMSDVAVEVADG